jgi:hypothetical protein
MVAHLETLILAALCAGVAFGTVVLLWAVVAQARKLSPISETLLISSVLTVLGINAEVRLLSSLPFSRPLDCLPWAHVTVLAVAIAVLHRRNGIQPWLSLLADLRSSVLMHWRNFEVGLRGAICLAVLLLTAYAVYGLAIGASGWDELAYHVPQAVQLYQDGRVADLDSWLPWTYSYPKGAAILWAWTMFFTKSDFLFHAVQLAFGLQLLLALYVLARRSGASAASALTVVIAVSYMPILAILTTTAGGDLGFAAACTAFLAFSAPSREPVNRASWPYAALCLVQAALIKVPVLAILFATIVVFFRVLPNLKDSVAAVRGAALTAPGAVALVAVLLGLCVPIATNVVRHGNPLYPLTVTIAKQRLWTGPIPPVQDFVTIHSSFPALERKNPIRVYHAVLADWFGPKNYDSTGTYGPVVLVAFVFLLGGFVFESFSTRNGWRITVCAVIGIALLLPGAYLPRYGLPVVAVIAACCAVFISGAPSSFQKWLRASVLAVAVVGGVQSANWLYAGLHYMRLINGVWFSPLRSSHFQETVQMGVAEFYPTPEMIRAIRTFSKRGDLLVWNVSCFHALLWNRDYSNRTLYLSATKGDRYPGGPERLSRPGVEEMSRWTSQIQKLRPAQVLVYSQSAYAEVLRSMKDPRYAPAFAESESKGRGAMVLFQREDP